MKNIRNIAIPIFFIHTDPKQIPKLYEEKDDIEIAGYLAASLP